VRGNCDFSSFRGVKGETKRGEGGEGECFRGGGERSQDCVQVVDPLERCSAVGFHGPVRESQWAGGATRAE